jgi:hypothetical protein
MNPLQRVGFVFCPRRRMQAEKARAARQHALALAEDQLKQAIQKQERRKQEQHGLLGDASLVEEDIVSSRRLWGRESRERGV